MYGLWILTIIFGSVGIALVGFSILSYKLYSNYDNRLEYKYKYTGEHSGITYESSTTFYGGKSDRKNLSEEEYQKYSKILKKKKFWSAIDDAKEVLYGIGVILLVAAFVLCIFAMFVPIGAQHEVVYWQNFVEMVETTINNSNEYQTIGISGDIIKYNSWLTKVKTSQELYGNWSQYYNVDLSQLEYIKI